MFKRFEMESSPSEHTAVFRMMKDYASFMRSPFHGSSNFSFRSEPGLESVPKFSFNLNTSFETSEHIDKGDSVPKLKRKLLEKEAEVQHDQAIISHLKSSFQSLEPHSKQMRIELEKELELTKQQCEIKGDRIAELQNQLHLLKDEGKELETELSTCREQMETDHTNYEQQIKTLQQKCQQLQVDLEEARSSEKKIAQDLTAEIKRLQAELKLTKKEIEQYKDQVQFLSQQVQEENKSVQENEKLKVSCQKFQQKIKELENEIASNEDSAVIVRAKQLELKQLFDFKKECTRLKEENTRLNDSSKNNLLLQEQLLSVQNHLQHIQQQNISLLKLEVEHEALKQRLKEWESLAVDANESVKQSPSLLSKQLNQLQKNESILMDSIGKLKTDIHVLEATNQKLTNKISALTLELQHEKSHANDQAAMYRRLQKKVLLISKERDSYKRVVSSYEEGKSSAISIQIEQIRSLENIIENYQNTIEQLEMQCNDLQKQLEKNHQSSAFKDSKKAEDTEEINKLREVISSQQLKIHQFEKDNQQLQEKLKDAASQQQEDNTSKLKVIHFKQNPQQMALQQKTIEMKQLKEENDRLRARITVLEKSGSEVADVSVRVQQHLQEQDPATIESLKGQLSSAEARQKRLMKAFQKTSREFREVCYILTGYRVDRTTQNKYKLSNMYAESQDDYLIFEHEPNGMKLLETPYSAHLTESIDLYLRQFDSIPAFLSSLTMDLLSRQTLIATNA